MLLVQTTEDLTGQMIASKRRKERIYVDQRYVKEKVDKGAEKTKDAVDKAADKTKDTAHKTGEKIEDAGSSSLRIHYE